MLAAQSTYIRRVQSCAWRLPKYWPPHPPIQPASVSSPRTKGGTHSPGGEGGGGSIFWKTPAIISLRLADCGQDSADPAEEDSGRVPGGELPEVLQPLHQAAGQRQLRHQATVSQTTQRYSSRQVTISKQIQCFYFYFGKLSIGN